MAVIAGPHRLVTYGVGSCLVVTLYDPKRQIGALAHTMLPLPQARHSQRQTYPSCASPSESPPNQRACLVVEQVPSQVKDAKYVGVAIDRMLQKMHARGSEREDLEAKLIGGANMFPSFDSHVGEDSVSRAEEKLRREGVRIVGECVGGSQGRSVEFSAATGVVTVRTRF